MSGGIKPMELKEVGQKLTESIAMIKGNVYEGVAVAGQFVKGEAQSLTPVDQGVLRQSAFSQMAGDKSKFATVVGFTAEYAPAVHEAPMTLKGQPRAGFGKTAGGKEFGGGSGKGRYWDGGENKFLEKAITRNLSKVFNIIANIAGRVK